MNFDYMPELHWKFGYPVVHAGDRSPSASASTAGSSATAGCDADRRCRLRLGCEPTDIDELPLGPGPRRGGHEEVRPHLGRGATAARPARAVARVARRRRLPRRRRARRAAAAAGLADGGTAEVTVRSKDKGGRLVAWTARVVELAPGSEAWEAAVAELKGKRLNAPDARGDDGALGPRVPGAAPGADRGRRTAPRPERRTRTPHRRCRPPRPRGSPAPAALPRLLRREGRETAEPGRQAAARSGQRSGRPAVPGRYRPLGFGDLLP